MWAALNHRETALPNPDDLLSFDDEPAVCDVLASSPPWRILVVDDDDDVHEATRLALDGLTILERPLLLLHAGSAAEAMRLLQRESDIAAILLDVVMESQTAGLDAVAHIREDLGLNATRIILCTGQPGYAPEIETIRRYDINDYKTKSELTRSKLYATLSTALRTYDQLCRIDESRRGLEYILAASHRLMEERDLHGFCHAVMTQLSQFMGVPADGLVCEGDGAGAVDEMTVLAGIGRYAGMEGRQLAEVMDNPARGNIALSMRRERNVIERNVLAIHLCAGKPRVVIGLLHFDALTVLNPMLLDLFTTNIALNGNVVRLIEKMRATAFIDGLTGLPNRAALIESLDQHIASLAGARDSVLTLIDIDQFAAINDLFGHAYGDSLLAAVGGRLRQHLSSRCFVARISNDIFAVLGPEDESNPSAVRRLFALPFQFDDAEHVISVCLGGLRLSESGGNGGDCLKDAWIAIKHAKGRGQNQLAWYSAEIGQITRGHARLLHALREAFKSERLFLAFQPQIEFATGRVVGVEALLRWRTEAGMFVSPADFIPIAESSGLIVPLGEWVLRRSLAAIQEIRARGQGDLRIAVNVSVVQFGSAGFLDMVDKALADSGMPSDALELEITESVAIMGAESVEHHLKALRDRGIAIALDDFGTGYSSLSYLDQLSADRIKIDRSFVNALDSGERGVRIAEMVIPLGKQLGMIVLAEGVETEAQAARLVELGCQEVQGFLYARPMPLPDLLAWLRGNGGKVK